MVRAVAFDFDGVIAESVDVKTQAFARMFADSGPAIVQKVVAYHLEHGGKSRVEKFRHFYRHYLNRELPNNELEVLCEKFRELVFNGVVAAPLVLGALESIRQLHSDGLLQFIVSGTPGNELEEIVALRKMRQYFAGVFGSPERKGELLRSILDSHRLQASEVLFIGDSVTDYEGARISGVCFVARSQAGDLTRWKALGVPFLSDLNALPSYIAKLNSLTASRGS